MKLRSSGFKGVTSTLFIFHQWHAGIWATFLSSYKWYGWHITADSLSFLGLDDVRPLSPALANQTVCQFTAVKGISPTSTKMSSKGPSIGNTLQYVRHLGHTWDSTPFSVHCVQYYIEDCFPVIQVKFCHHQLASLWCTGLKRQGCGLLCPMIFTNFTTVR